jgi:hypothetical protein
MGINYGDIQIDILHVECHIMEKQFSKNRVPLKTLKIWKET